MQGTCNSILLQSVNTYVITVVYSLKHEILFWFQLAWLSGWECAKHCKGKDQVVRGVVVEDKLSPTTTFSTRIKIIYLVWEFNTTTSHDHTIDLVPSFIFAVLKSMFPGCIVVPPRNVRRFHKQRRPLRWNWCRIKCDQRGLCRIGVRTKGDWSHKSILSSFDDQYNANHLVLWIISILNANELLTRKLLRIQLHQNLECLLHSLSR